MEPSELTQHFRDLLKEEIARAKKLRRAFRILRLLGIELVVHSRYEQSVALKLWGVTLLNESGDIDTNAAPVEVCWVERFLSEEAYESIGRQAPEFENWKEYQSGTVKILGDRIDFERLEFILRPVNSDLSLWVWGLLDQEGRSELFTSEPMSMQAAKQAALDWARELFFGGGILGRCNP